MTDEHDDAKALIETVLHELATEAETLLLLATAVQDRATGISSNAPPQKVRETAALVKGAALQITIAAATLVGTAERLRLVAEFSAVATSSDLPS
jgi:hypothetical protein